MTNMNTMVWRNWMLQSTSILFRRKVTMVASVITKHTAPDIPTAVLSLEDTPRKGQIPRNWLRTMLLTNIAEMMMKM